MFQKEFVEKIKPRTFYVQKLFFGNYDCLGDNVKMNCCRSRQATDDNMAHAHCMLDTKQHQEYVILIAFPRQRLCINAPQCYVISTFYVLFSLETFKELYFIPSRSPVFSSLFFIPSQLLFLFSFWNILFLPWC